MLKQISVEGFEPIKNSEPRGKQVSMKWINIDNLRVDTRFQRNILKGGKSNTRQIANRFSWRKFTPVVVCELDNGLYSIIDGQHRVTAAKLLGLVQVPCAIVDATTVEEQADSFKSINANITRVSQQDLYFADLAAKLSYTQDISNFCQKAGVTIIRPGIKPKKGDCASVSVVKQCLRDFGETITVHAFKTIVANPGSEGMLKPTLVKAVCKLLKANPEWQLNPKFGEAFNTVNLRFEVGKAQATVTQYNTPTITVLMQNLHTLLSCKLK